MFLKALFAVLISLGWAILPVDCYANDTEIKSVSTSEIAADASEIDANDILSQQVSSQPEMIKDLDGPPARSVRIDLSLVEGAAFYETMITPVKQIWDRPMKFVTTPERSTVLLRLSPGQYRVQTRSLDEKKNPGRWSEVRKFWVQFRPIANAYPPPNEEVRPKGSKTESIIFEWPAIEHAKYYFFRLKDANGKILRMAITGKNYLKSELQIDSKYSWTVMPMKQQSQYKALLRQDRVAPYIPFAVGLPDTEARGTLVKIQRNRKAIKYQFEVVSVDPSESTSPPVVIDSYEPSTRLRLPPGQYQMRARSLYEDNSTTEWSSPSSFFVKRFVPHLSEPAQNAQIEPTEDIKNKVTLRWKEDPSAFSFKVYVYNSQNQLVLQKEAKENFTEVELPHDETYHWTVRSFSAREPASDPVDPSEALGAFQIGHYVPLDLKASEEPSQYYGWLRQISSVEQYHGENYENNAIVEQKFLGGETEAAIGYWHRQSRLGLLAQASVAGFQFQGQIYTYNSLGVHIGYRHLLENGDRLRFWLGAAYREMPEVITTPFTSVVTYNKIKSLGPLLQVAYQHSFDQKKGIQVSGATFYSQGDQGTPTGESQVPMLSYRASILGTYVWSETLRLLGGYTYRLEHAAYDSGDTRGAVNTAQISGHYFSLILEFALAPAMK